MAVPEKPNNLPPGYKAGKTRVYHSAQISPADLSKSAFTVSDYRNISAILALAVLVRIYRLPLPPRVVFDETHFGSFARDYFHGTFFVDVHPPLVKLLFYWVACFCGWDGDFEFQEIGDIYDNNVPYVAMRFVSVITGVIGVASVYVALRASGCRARIAGIGALLVVFENSLVTQSRLIMLDSGLVGFTALAVSAFKKFQLTKPFSRRWFQTLLTTGVALGLTVSTKLTGLFTIMWVSVWSAYEMWCYLGDLEVSYKALFAHIIGRIVGFIVVPATIYCGLFSIHFMLLPNNGSGSGIMSPSFKAELADSDGLRNTAVDVAYGSTITIKHHRLDSYLHSHNYVYQSGSHEQQVTMYGFNDDSNNEWIIETHGTNYDGKFDTKFRPIKDGDIVKLFHKKTRKYLRVNDVRPPNSEHDYSKEVSCHGNQTNTEDSAYEWRVKLHRKMHYSENDLPLRKLRATESVFQLVHKGTSCVLMGHDVLLPEWGFHQNQVLCMNGPNLQNTWWYIENNNHPIIDEDVKNYPRVKLPRLSLFQKLVEYHRAMWLRNSSFTKEHDYSSIPAYWPFVTRGINYFSNGFGVKKIPGEIGSHIYLLGNVFIYYGGLLVLIMFGFQLPFYLLNYFNPFKQTYESSEEMNHYTTMLQYISGWAFHYIPFWMMSRQLFVHHYLTSVLFLILATSQYMEGMAQRAPSITLRVFEAFLVCVVLFFIRFSPLVYGSPWTLKQCQHSKWFPGWDFDCMAYTY